MTQQTISNQISRVPFDVKNREHVLAFKTLVQDGRQHPTLRFNLEPPFLDIRSMLTAKMTNALLDMYLREEAFQ